MPCYKPLIAWQRSNGSVVFAERGEIHHQLTLACGQCIGCRLERSRQWAVRIMHEAKLHKQNSFVTLTYADEYLPNKYFTGLLHPKTGERIYSGTVNVRDVQLFLKRLRKALSKEATSPQGTTRATELQAHMGAHPHTPLKRLRKALTKKKAGDLQLLGAHPHTPRKIRFYQGAEYGEQYGRPHYHICLFGIDFQDKIYLGKSQAGHKLYTSKTIEKAWPQGLHSLGELTFESAAYTARYIMKKITGNRQKTHYEKIDLDTGQLIHLKPEFNTMSRMPGIGHKWLKKFHADVYPHGKVIVRGHQTNAPRYYDKQFKALDPEGYDRLQWTKELEGRQHIADQTPERLKVREQVTAAKIKMLKRKI